MQHLEVSGTTPIVVR